MAPIVESVEVDRPAAEVFAYATDPTRFSEWQKGVVDGHLDSTHAPAAGDTCRTTRRTGGANHPTTSVLAHIDPPRTWGVRGIDGPIRATVDVPSNPSPTPEAGSPSPSTSTGTAWASSSSRS